MNEKFRTIGLDTEDKITEFIDYIDDLEDTEEIKSDVYGFFEEESSYNENHIPAYVVMTKYKGKYIVWVEDQCCDFAISYPPYNLCDIFSTYDEANEYYKSLAHSGIKPLSEQVEECKSQLIDEVDLRVSTMVPNVLNIKVWYKNCLIIEHLTQFDVQYINNVQQDNFLTYIKNSKYAYYYPLFVFMLETALRVGEVCGLTWDDVDLEHGFVNITHQLQYNNVGKDACQYQILTPKSKSGVRNVPLSNAARDALMEQMKNQIEMDKKTEIEIDGYKDFVFSNRQNKPFITQTIGRILNRIVDDYNSDIKKFGGTIEPLPHIHPHLLRHTSCSRMAEAGVDPRTLQDIMGHASMKMTMELYNHVTNERLTNEIQKLNNRRIS